jgi:hypothetical protein
MRALHDCEWRIWRIVKAAEVNVHDLPAPEYEWTSLEKPWKISVAIADSEVEVWIPDVLVCTGVEGNEWNSDSHLSSVSSHGLK